MWIAFWGRMSHTSSLRKSYNRKGESPLWVMWFCGISHDITLHLMSFSASEGPDICRTGGIGDAWVIIWHSADSSVSTMLVGVVAVCFNMSCAIAEDTLGELGASLHWMPCMGTPSIGGIFIIWAVLHP